MKMSKWFLEFTKLTDEVPMQIIFNFDTYSDVDSNWPELTSGIIYSFADLSSTVLERVFDDGFGGKNAPHFVAYSPNYIMLSTEYDGAEGWACVPRNPTTGFGWCS